MGRHAAAVERRSDDGCDDFLIRKRLLFTSIHLGGSSQIVRDFTRERALLSPSEKTVLRTFQQYLITPGKMLCFTGPSLEKHSAALQELTEKDLLVKEQFKGAYSLTRAGIQAMRTCDK